MPPKSKIILVDDHAVFREGLALIIAQENDMEVCGEFDNAAAALKEVQNLNPAMAIIDISLEGTNGIDLTKSLRARFPKLRVLILSMHKEFLYAERAMRAGANGYIMKQHTRRSLMDAIRHVLNGHTYLSDAIKEHLLQGISATHSGKTISPVERLSDREYEIFQLIARGYGTRQIAENLNLSPKTVETHREHIRQKLNVQTSFELVQYAHEWADSIRNNADA